MQWDWRAGPAFIVTLVLAILTGLQWFTDNRASALWVERVVRLETQMLSVINSTARIETKLDTMKNNGR